MIVKLPSDRVCKHPRITVYLADSPIGAIKRHYVVHQNCFQNQLVGVMNRVLGVTPQPTLEGRRRMLKGARFLGRHLPCTVQEPLGAFALHYGGAKRAKYLRAAEEVRLNGLTRRDAGVKMFIKPDRLDVDLKRMPDPRAIQFRDPRYCVVIASYLKPIEPHLYSLTIPSVSPTRLIGKGCNQFERARILLSKWRRFRKPVAIVVDANRFDKHCNVWLLKAEHLVYKMSNPDPEFQRLLKWQLKNFCRSDLGLKYKTHGKRMSGDMNTALGNCIIMLLMCFAVLNPLNVMYDIFDDGDDCIILCEEDNLSAVQTAVTSMIQFGMQIKIESLEREFERISWCQSQPINTHRGWKFCREPRKVLSATLIGHKWYHLNTAGRLTYLRGLAECECILNKGVPVLQAFSEALLRNTGKGKLAHDTSSGEYFRYMRELKEIRSVSEVVPITDEARVSFSKAFGIDVTHQYLLEHSLQQWTFNVEGTTFDGPVRDEFWHDQRTLFSSQ